MDRAGIWNPRYESQRFGPGEEVQQVQPGDFLLTHANAWSSKLIRWGETLRYHGLQRKFAHWSHAALFINPNGDIIEALGGGVQQRNVSVYRDTEYQVIRLLDPLPETNPCYSAACDPLPEERCHAAAFAHRCLNDHYGFLTDISLALTLLTAAKFCFGVDGQMICSGLVARALERTGAIFPHDSWRMLPADLAKQFNITPVPGSSQGVIPNAKTARIAWSH
jgi:cell wall-associated NlpC family hydrolase